ncbi:MAG: alpha-L-fucosidase [bacterium]
MAGIPFRQVHLDFHTSPLIEGVGEDFDPGDFARTLKEAYVNSVTVFAKCHHGMSYYPTKVGVVHPHLKRDLLGEMIEACHKEGIRTPVYITVVWDEHAAATHADWLQVGPDGKLIGRGPLETLGWRWLCMNSPYADYVIAQTEEVVENYPVDGIFFDIIMQGQCVCNHCVREMEERKIDYSDPVQLYRFSVEVARRFMKRAYKVVKDRRPEATVFFNSRLRILNDVELGMRLELGEFTHIEIESLPSGAWGYNHYPLMVRYFQTLGKEILGMTGRFHRSWADFGGLKNLAALEYECFQMLATGAKCSIGDQLHPRGAMDKTVYRRIGEVYKSVAEKEPWCEGAEPLAQIGVISSRTGRSPEEMRGQLALSDEGALKILQELHHQFQFIDNEADLSRYDLVIAPDSIGFDKSLADKVRKFIKGGGGLILTGRSGLDVGTSQFALREFGLKYVGEAEYSPNYIRARKPISDGIEPMDYVMYEGGVAVEAASRAEVLATVVDPYFNRTFRQFSSHRQTPPHRESKYPAIVRSGNVIYFSHPIFRLYILHGSWVYKKLICNAIDLLLGGDRLLSTSIPSSGHATVTRQTGRYIVHLLYYVPERRTKDIDIIEDVVPLANVNVSLKMAKRPGRVYLAPSKSDIPFLYEGGRVNCTVPEVRGHGMVVFEE